jgi:putative intracellular protease/amidase
VPFLVEHMLATNGGVFFKGADWASHVVVDGKLVTGQSPASSKEAAETSELTGPARTVWKKY